MSLAKKKIKGLPTIKISQLDDKNIKEVWILNVTGNKNVAVKGPKGVIALDVKNRSDGSSTLVEIPPTWVPICLTDQVPKQMLSDSPKFRSILSGGYIKLLDPDAVHQLMQDPEVQEEINSIRNKTASFFKENLEDGNPIAEKTAGVVLEIIARESDGTMTEAEARDILNTREEELTNADLDYLIKSSTLARKWAADVLAEREEEV
jgi:hypothetical protein